MTKGRLLVRQVLLQGSRNKTFKYQVKIKVKRKQFGTKAKIKITVIRRKRRSIGQDLTHGVKRREIGRTGQGFYQGPGKSEQDLDYGLKKGKVLIKVEKPNKCRARSCS